MMAERGIVERKEERNMEGEVRRNDERYEQNHTHAHTQTQIHPHKAHTHTHTIKQKTVRAMKTPHRKKNLRRKGRGAKKIIIQAKVEEKIIYFSIIYTSYW